MRDLAQLLVDGADDSVGGEAAGAGHSKYFSRGTGAMDEIGRGGGEMGLFDKG